MTQDLFMRSSAGISDCGMYRTWDERLPSVCFCMLNPSRADHEQDDPTIRRCMGFARDWKCGGVPAIARPG